MRNKNGSRYLPVLVWSGLVLLLTGVRYPASLGQGTSAASSGEHAADEVPNYHTSAPPRKSLPATLDPMKFSDPITQNAYAMAAKAKSVLYQQPCYCHCDKGFGHASLLDCFTGTHAAVCNICKEEAIYAVNESARKKSAGQIREGIIKGEWQKIDLAKYREYKPASTAR